MLGDAAADARASEGARRLRLPDAELAAASEGRVLAAELSFRFTAIESHLLAVEIRPPPVWVAPSECDSTPASTAAFIKAEIAKWGDLVKLADAKVD